MAEDKKPRRSKGDGCITWDEKRQRYRAILHLGFGAKGRRQTCKRDFLTLKKARAWLKEATRRLEEGESIGADTLTLGEYLTDWLEKEVRPNARTGTYLAYEQEVRLRLLPALGAIRLSRLSPLHVRDYLLALAEEGRTKKKLQQAKGCLSSALTRAVELHLVRENVCRLVRCPQGRPSRCGQPLSAEQMTRLQEAMRGHPLEVLLTLTLAYGLRLGEASGLRWEDVKLEDRELRIRRQLQLRTGQGMVAEEPKSRKSQRALPLLGFVSRLLVTWQAEQQVAFAAIGREWSPSDYLATRPDGSPVSPVWVRSRYQALLAKAGIPHRTVHDLRHSTATYLMRHGVPTRVIQLILGHSSPAITMGVYEHPDQALIAEGLEVMERLLGDDA